MPCALITCNAQYESLRLVASIIGIYAYHFLWNHFVITPITFALYHAKYLPKGKIEKLRECMWKSVAVSTFFVFGYKTAGSHSWWMNSKEFFLEWPEEMSEDLSWYYMLYFAFWIQSVDFLFNITGKHYAFPRKDIPAMFVHHIATMILMIFGYGLDLIRIACCVLMLHDVNDIILDTGKIFVYTNYENVANVFFVAFVISWFFLRWYFYATQFVYVMFTDGYTTLVANSDHVRDLTNTSLSFWYYTWLFIVLFLALLQLLHIYWGALIINMIVRTVTVGKIEKDIRSDSEDEQEGEVSSKALVREEAVEFTVKSAALRRKVIR